MSKPIVVGLDPEHADRAPLIVAASLARATGAPLVAVATYLHDPISNAVSAGIVDEDLRGTALRGLESLVGDVDAELLVRGGSSPARVLHDVAADMHATLIVVGSTKKGRLGRVAPGSTAERLVHGAPCPVLLAPTGVEADWEPRRIGVGFIDLDEGTVALAAAASLAQATGATLHARTAVEPVLLNRSAVIQPYEAERETAMAAARHALDAALELLPQAVGATSDVVDSRAAEALVDLSDRVDVLVCGSRGYGPARSVLVGAVAHQVLRDAHCPVLIAPRGVDASLETATDLRETSAT